MRLLLVMVLQMSVALGAVHVVSAVVTWRAADTPTLTANLMSAGLLLLLAAVVGIITQVHELHTLAKRETALVDAAMAMPWPTVPSVDHHAIEVVRASLPYYQVETIPLNDDEGPGWMTGLDIYSSAMTGDGKAFRLHMRRQAWQRPFSLSDKLFVEATAAIARESLRADLEMRRLHVNIDVDQLTNARFRDEISAVLSSTRGVEVVLELNELSRRSASDAMITNAAQFVTAAGGAELCPDPGREPGIHHRLRGSRNGSSRLRV